MAFLLSWVARRLTRRLQDKKMSLANEEQVTRRKSSRETWRHRPHPDEYSNQSMEIPNQLMPCLAWKIGIFGLLVNGEIFLEMLNGLIRYGTYLNDP